MSQLVAVFKNDSESLSSSNLSNIEAFKEVVLEALGGEKPLSLKTDKDWFDLRNEVKDTLTMFNEATVGAYILEETSKTYDDVEVYGDKPKSNKQNNEPNDKKIKKLLGKLKAEQTRARERRKSYPASVTSVRAITTP